MHAVDTKMWLRAGAGAGAAAGAGAGARSGKKPEQLPVQDLDTVRAGGLMLRGRGEDLKGRG